MLIQMHSTDTDAFLANYCYAMSMNFVVCQLGGLLPPLLRKARVVLPSFVRNVSNTIRTLAKHKCSSLIGAPKLLHDILTHKDLDSYDLSALKFIMSGSQIVSGELMRLAFDRWQLVYFGIIYGMSEILVATSFRIDDVSQCDTRGAVVSFPVGPPMGLFEFKVVDLANASAVMPIGSSGELLVKSLCVMNGYWMEEEKTREAIDSDGW